MRLAVLLGCLYVLLLSVKPCCINDACLSKQATQTKQTNTAGKGNIPCTDCSPFFSCGTCTGFVIAKPIVHSLVLYTENNVQPYPAYLPPYVHETSRRIWQPPQWS